MTETSRGTTPLSDRRDTPARSMGPLIGTLGIQVAATACTLAVPILSPSIDGMTVSDVGAYVATLYVGAAVGGITGGSLVGRHGPVRASQLALVMQALALLLVIADVTLARLAGAFLCGLAYGPINPASSQILARTTPAERLGMVFALKQTGVPLGGLLGGAILPSLALFASWQIALSVLAATAVVVAISCNGLRRTLDTPLPTDSQRRHYLAPITSVLTHPTLRAMASVSFLFSSVQLCLSGYLMIYIARDLGIDLIRAGMLYAIAQAAGIIGRLMWGYLADRVRSAMLVLLLLAALMTFSLLALSLATPDWGMVQLGIVVALFGMSAIGWNGVFLGEVARLARPGEVAMITGGALFFTFIGAVIGPPTFGWGAEQFGMKLSFAALACAPGAAFLLLLWNRKSRR